ncbi:MAG: ABC transporter ATP-binding protein [Pseudomonadota bacterium]
MLELRGVTSGYGEAMVLRDVSFTAVKGEIHCLMGRNGAGKTTTLQTIMGLLPLREGDIALDGRSISQLPAHEVPLNGLGYVPQGRRLFAGLSVAENLDVALRAHGGSADLREEVLDLFPRLRDRLSQAAETLSGGEQQMLATARALCLRPKILLLDEPTEGLQPSVIDTIQTVIIGARDKGLAVLLVEQRIDAVLAIADRITFVENGRVMSTLPAVALHEDRKPFTTYLGV